LLNFFFFNLKEQAKYIRKIRVTEIILISLCQKYFGATAIKVVA
jgi:hypothetical protein